VIAESDRPVLVEALGAVSVGLLGEREGEGGVERSHSDFSGEERSVSGRCAMLKWALSAPRSSVVLVSEEVGLAPHPLTSLGREFVDIHGCINQVVADLCDDVYLVVAGRVLPLSRGSQAVSVDGLFR
jgi:adenosyl cobinamide kinase/adenosyl cobinamide phosphate guanylyltransferase